MTDSMLQELEMAEGGCQLGAGASLEQVLSAWHVATLRLERTHEALREEVARLTHELEIKNRELARQNRLADLGQMASHVAHEVRNNLVPVSLYLSLLRRRLLADSGSLAVLEKVQSGLTALDATVNDLLHFTAQRDPQLEQVALDALVEEVLASLAPQLAAQQIEALTAAVSGAVVVADRGMLRRALLNLVLNALDVMPQGGRLAITAHCGTAAVELEVTDSGPGFSPEAERRACEPFFTTKSNGTGLGLAIVERMAEAHGGSVTAGTAPGGGARLTIRIPHPQLAEAA